MTIIFVFGSNIAGRHGRGAALAARLHHGAIYGVGEGRTGNAYALPTKDGRLNVLTLERIKLGVKDFLDYAKGHPELAFQVTCVGTGLAGYTDEQMAPMFRGATANCQFADRWLPYLNVDAEPVRA